MSKFLVRENSIIRFAVWHSGLDEDTVSLDPEVSRCLATFERDGILGQTEDAFIEYLEQNNQMQFSLWNTYRGTPLHQYEFGGEYRMPGVAGYRYFLTRAAAIAAQAVASVQYRGLLALRATVCECTEVLDGSHYWRGVQVSDVMEAPPPEVHYKVYNPLTGENTLAVNAREVRALIAGVTTGAFAPQGGIELRVDNPFGDVVWGEENGIPTVPLESTN